MHLHALSDIIRRLAPYVPAHNAERNPLVASPRTKEKHKPAAPQPFLIRVLSSPGFAAVAIFVVAFVVYANTLGHEFVWDDRDLILNNPSVKTLTTDSIKSMFGGEFWSRGGEVGGYYRPLVTLSYHLQWKLSGGNPALFHFANVTWNAVVCALVFLFLFLLTGNAVTGAIAGLLFAVHPIHTENVAWVAGRTDVLAMLWAMLSLVLYVAGRRQPMPRSLFFAGGSLVAFFLSLLAKESVAVLPLVILLMELGPTGKLVSRRDDEAFPMKLLHPVPFFAALGGYLLLRSNILGTAATHYERYAEGAAGLVGLPLSILGGYVLKLIAPIRLNGEYDAYVPETIAHWSVLLGALCLALIVFAMLRYRKQPLVVFGSGVFLLGLLPVLNVIPLGEISAERFLYFPSLGFVIVLAAVFSPSMFIRFTSLENMPTVPHNVRPSLSRATAANIAFVFGVVVLLAGVRTVVRNNDWRDEMTLFTKTVQAAPDSPRAHLNVGNANMRLGNRNAAIASYRRAIEIDPDYPDALSNLAGIYAQQGDMKTALPYIQRAVEAAPNNLTLSTNLGVLYYELGDKDASARTFMNLLEYHPADLNAHYYLGRIRYEQKKIGTAAKHLQRVAGKGDVYALAYLYLAEIAADGGNNNTARTYAQEFIRAYTTKDDNLARAREIMQLP